MINPLRKEEHREKEQLTTGDIARNRPDPSESMPVRSERPGNVASFPEKRPSAAITERDATSFPERSAAARAPKGTSARTEEQGNAGAPLFLSNEGEQLHERWTAIQVSFVDEPRTAVQQADELVAATMKRLAEVFSQERSNLERQWDQGAQVSTEDLRLALQRYRSFFQRLLAI